MAHCSRGRLSACGGHGHALAGAASTASSCLSRVLPATCRTAPGHESACDSLQRVATRRVNPATRSEEHTSELQSLMRISYAVFCLTKQKQHTTRIHII